MSRLSASWRSDFGVGCGERDLRRFAVLAGSAGFGPSWRGARRHGRRASAPAPSPGATGVVAAGARRAHDRRGRGGRCWSCSAPRRPPLAAPTTSIAVSAEDRRARAPARRACVLRLPGAAAPHCRHQSWHALHRARRTSRTCARAAAGASGSGRARRGVSGRGRLLARGGSRRIGEQRGHGPILARRFTHRGEGGAAGHDLPSGRLQLARRARAASSSG